MFNLFKRKKGKPQNPKFIDGRSGGFGIIGDTTNYIDSYGNPIKGVRNYGEWLKKNNLKPLPKSKPPINSK